MAQADILKYTKPKPPRITLPGRTPTADNRPVTYGAVPQPTQAPSWNPTPPSNQAPGTMSQAGSVYPGMPDLEDIVRRAQEERERREREAKPPAANPSAPSGPAAFSGQGSFQDWFMGLANQAAQGGNYNQNWLLGMEELLGQSGSRLTGANAQGERTKIWDPQRQDWARVGFGEGTPVWVYQGWGANGPQASQGGGQVFSDPATREWEELLRKLVERLNQPQPTYTDAQRELMQTQAIDPLERQRQAQRQNTMQRFASMGHGQSSGPLEQALQDLDRQFDQMRTGQQSQFALNQINREDQLFNSNEQRALAGLNLFSQIPQLADSRMAAANSVMQGQNPMQLLQLLNLMNQQGIQNGQWNQMQNQQFWSWLGQMLADSFGR